MEDFTRLEKVIEATAEAETELKPETRLEKVILDTGAKIQEEIAGAGGDIYMHKISWGTTNPTSAIVSFILYTSNDIPFTKQTCLDFLKNNRLEIPASKCTYIKNEERFYFVTNCVVHNLPAYSNLVVDGYYLDTTTNSVLHFEAQSNRFSSDVVTKM